MKAVQKRKKKGQYLEALSRVNRTPVWPMGKILAGSPQTFANKTGIWALGGDGGLQVSLSQAVDDTSKTGNSPSNKNRSTTRLLDQASSLPLFLISEIILI